MNYLRIWVDTNTPLDIALEALAFTEEERAELRRQSGVRREKESRTIWKRRIHSDANNVRWPGEAEGWGEESDTCCAWG